MAIDGNQLRAQGVYQARVPLQSILDDLGQIQTLVREISTQRRNIRIAAGIAVLAGLASGAGAGATGSKLLALGAYCGLILGLVLLICSFSYGRALVKHQDRYGLMRGLSTVLIRDADKQASFSARLAFKPKPTKIKEEPWPQRKNGKQQFLEEEFISLEGEMLDGTVLTHTINELTRKRTYRNPRGKYKTKLRSRYLLTLRFDYPRDIYGDARPANESLHELPRIPESATLRDIRVTEKAIVVKAVIGRKDDIVKASIMLSLGAYRVLNLARRLAGSAPGAAS